MTPELLVLTLAALLQMAQFLLYSVLANLQVGPGYAMSPRDTPRQLTGSAGRAQRALNNHFEGLILFAIAALLIAQTGQSTAVTQAAAWTYLGARILYVPAYLLGWAPGRSLIWGIGWIATLTLLIAALI